MRNYPTNSPEAMARIVTCALLGDIENPALRARTLWMMFGLVNADGSVTSDEARLLSQAARVWSDHTAAAH